MIPKPLDRIGWADLEALKESGREEGDTIEYKGSFSGGSDFGAFTEAQRGKAIRGIAREVIAFLNGRGGDLIIGAEEDQNSSPRIKAFKQIPNLAATADRLAQSLSATIEPYQSVLGVRAIRCADTDQGVIAVRAPASLRAPHRFVRDKECYVRRGRESVAMPMDEIQDLTVRRYKLRNERLEMLAAQFADISSDRVGRTFLDRHRFHIRLSYLPSEPMDLEIEDDGLRIFLDRGRKIQCFDGPEYVDVPFRNLTSIWKPVLRGKKTEDMSATSRTPSGFFYSSKEIKRSGIFTADFACRVPLGEGEENIPGLYHDWLAGFAAQNLVSLERFSEKRSRFCPGIMRIGVFVDGPITSWMKVGLHQLVAGDWHPQTSFLPDFEISKSSDFGSIFIQVQDDLAAIAGLELRRFYEFCA